MKNPFERRTVRPAVDPEPEMEISVSDQEEEQRLKQQMADADQQVEACCLALGKAYLELHREDYEPAFASWMQSIRKLEEEKQACRQKWLDLKGIVICSHCGAESPKEARYCGSCGQRLADSQPQEIPEGFKQCAHCGQIQDGKIRFCMNCGAPMGDQPQTPPDDSGVKPAVGVRTEPSKVIPPVDPQPEARCPSCGAAVDPDAVFCPECGASLTPAPAGVRECPNCHAPVEEGAVFCTECGTRL